MWYVLSETLDCPDNVWYYVSIGRRDSPIENDNQPILIGGFFNVVFHFTSFRKASEIKEAFLISLLRASGDKNTFY